MQTHCVTFNTGIVVLWQAIYRSNNASHRQQVIEIVSAGGLIVVLGANGVCRIIEKGIGELAKYIATINMALLINLSVSFI